MTSYASCDHSNDHQFSLHKSQLDPSVHQSIGKGVLEKRQIRKSRSILCAMYIKSKDVVHDMWQKSTLTRMDSNAVLLCKKSIALTIDPWNSFKLQSTYCVSVLCNAPVVCKEHKERVLLAELCARWVPLSIINSMQRWTTPSVLLSLGRKFDSLIGWNQVDPCDTLFRITPCIIHYCVNAAVIFAQTKEW